jgi:hypothetical protein
MGYAELIADPNVVWFGFIELVQDRQGLGWFALLKQSFDVGSPKSGSSTALRH